MKSEPFDYLSRFGRWFRFFCIIGLLVSFMPVVFGLESFAASVVFGMLGGGITALFCGLERESTPARSSQRTRGLVEAALIATGSAIAIIFIPGAKIGSVSILIAGACYFGHLLALAIGASILSEGYPNE